MKQVRVLLVDDSGTFLDSATELLSHDPRVLVVGRARNGRDGVRLARELAPDLVLMDLTMAELDGFSATRLIKSLKAPPRVLIVSLQDAAVYRRRAREAPANGFIAKANYTEDVLAAIDAFFAAPRSTGITDGSE